ncbi:MAG: 2-dehydropantoate 2-reductase [Proteobacteria bacterium SG_bin9]|nr:MAG: 2-dehydropantoate 2-reductase [Proteobacteria bacterium SG_bin9]
MRIAVMGAGAIGCYFGGLLAKAGHDVTLIGRAQHVDAVRANGLLFESKAFHGHIPLSATTEPSGVAGADLILFSVKSADTEKAGAEILPHLTPDAAILCLQNGVDNAERLRTVVPQTVIASAVYVATEMAGPGHVKHNGRGELAIENSPVTPKIVELLKASAIPTTVSDRVRDVLWTKLITNCVVNPLSALSDLSYRPLMQVEGMDVVVKGVIAECCMVARALGVSVPANIEEIVLSIPKTMPHQKSSTAQDLARGKPTEIDYLNGYVVREGSKLCIPTPMNLTLHALVKAREAQTANGSTAP